MGTDAGRRPKRRHVVVVNVIRTLEADQSIQFDVYFNKFELDADNKTVKVGLPPT
jgi:hypothetical protein